MRIIKKANAARGKVVKMRIEKQTHLCILEGPDKELGFYSEYEEKPEFRKDYCGSKRYDSRGARIEAERPVRKKNIAVGRAGENRVSN